MRLSVTICIDIISSSIGYCFAGLLLLRLILYCCIILIFSASNAATCISSSWTLFLALAHSLELIELKKLTKYQMFV